MSATPSSASPINVLSNGSFESGSFTPGWTTYNAGGGGWSVSSTGQSSLGPANAPVDGNYLALFDQDDPSSGVLLSDAFTVPTNSTLTLDFAYDNAAGSWVQSGSPFDLSEPNQWLEVDVISASAAYDTTSPSDILLTLFNSQTGSASPTQSWESLSASLASLAGQSVKIRVAAVDTNFFLPVWVDGVDVTGAPPNVTGLAVAPGVGALTATWAANDDASSYTCTLMYGYDTPSTFVIQTSSSSCTFNGLVPGSTWGIQVVANNYGQTSAPEVSFATVPIPTVSPHKTTHRIVCERQHPKRLVAVTGVNPHCPSGYYQIS